MVRTGGKRPYILNVWMERFSQEEVDVRGKAEIANGHPGSCTSNHFHCGCNLPEPLILRALTEITTHRAPSSSSVTAQPQWVPVKASGSGLLSLAVHCPGLHPGPQLSRRDVGWGKSKQIWFIAFNSSLPTSGCMRQWQRKPTELISCFTLLERLTMYVGPWGHTG